MQSCARQRGILDCRVFQLGSFPLLGSGSWKNYPLCCSKDSPTECTPVAIYCLQLTKKDWFVCFIEERLLEPGCIGIKDHPDATYTVWNPVRKISALTFLTSFPLDPSQQRLPPYSAAQVKWIKRKLAKVILYIKQEIKHQRTLKGTHWYGYLMYHLIQIISVYIY